jgi:ABC-2 type transport system permease protein
MGLWWAVMKRSFRRHATYRGATLAGLFTNTIFGFIQAYVMLAIFSQRGDVGGFDRQDALTYVFVTQGFLMVINVFAGPGEISARVRSGDIVTDFYRPVDFQAYSLALDLGRASFQLLARAVPPFLVGAAVFDLELPSSPAVAVGFAVATVLATVASFGFRFLVGLAAFWILDDRGPAQILGVIWMFFSGFILPINFFPAPLEALARVLPFQVMLQVPVEIFLGKHVGPDLLAALAVQLVWVVVLLGIGRVVLRSAMRKLVIQGG